MQAPCMWSGGGADRGPVERLQEGSQVLPTRTVAGAPCVPRRSPEPPEAHAGEESHLHNSGPHKANAKCRGTS